MAKAIRATDKLNAAVSRISAAATVLGTLIDDIPAKDRGRELRNLALQIDAGVLEAYAALRAIKTVAESI